jgi:hypothetical protein
MVVTILLYMEEETMMIDILHDYLQRTEETIFNTYNTVIK